MWCRRLAPERVRHLDARVPPAQRVLVRRADADEVSLQRLDERARHDRDAILAALAAAHDDLAVVELQVLHPQLQRFHHAEPAAVEHVCDQAILTFHCGENRASLRCRAHDRQVRRRLGAYDAVAPGQLDFEHLPVEKENCRHGLVLRGRGHMTIDGEVGEEILGLGTAEFRWVALLMEEYVTANPEHVLLLGAEAVCSVHSLSRTWSSRRGFASIRHPLQLQLTTPGFGGLFGPYSCRGGTCE